VLQTRFESLGLERCPVQNHGSCNPRYLYFDCLYSHQEIRDKAPYCIDHDISLMDLE
jgi:hypothetical protein